MSNISSIDLNCDLGEGYDDIGIMPYLSSCNIACGGHAGDRMTISETVQLAQSNGVAIGAHPSYPDKANFGRISMNLEKERLLKSLQEQLNLITECCRKNSATLHHIKPHGALYNDLANDLELALMVMGALSKDHPKLCFYGMAHSAMELAAQQLGLAFVREVFADRTYTSRTQLMSRKKPGAVLTSTNEVVSQVNGFLSATLTDGTGNTHHIHAETICLHSDTSAAVSLAQTISDHLKNNNVLITTAR